MGNLKQDPVWQRNWSPLISTQQRAAPPHQRKPPHAGVPATKRLREHHITRSPVSRTELCRGTEAPTNSRAALTQDPHAPTAPSQWPGLSEQKPPGGGASSRLQKTKEAVTGQPGQGTRRWGWSGDPWPRALKTAPESPGALHAHPSAQPQGRGRRGLSQEESSRDRTLRGSGPPAALLPPRAAGGRYWFHRKSTLFSTPGHA